MTRQIMVGAVVGFILTAGGLWLMGRMSADVGPVDAGAPEPRDLRRPDPSLIMQRVGPRAIVPLRVPGQPAQDAGR